MELKITPSGQTIVKPTALGPGANTDTKLLIYGLFQKGRVLAQDGVGNWALRVNQEMLSSETQPNPCPRVETMDAQQLNTGRLVHFVEDGPKCVLRVFPDKTLVHVS